jgi:hypothetical protein
MSILTASASPKAAAQAKEKRDSWALALVLVVICLSNVVLVLASDTFARALELTGQQ